MKNQFPVIRQKIVAYLVAARNQAAPERVHHMRETADIARATGISRVTALRHLGLMRDDRMVDEFADGRSSLWLWKRRDPALSKEVIL